MSEVSRTVTNSVSAGSTSLTWVNDSKLGIHDSTVDWVAVFIIGVSHDYLCNGHLADILRGQEAELD